MVTYMKTFNQTYAERLPYAEQMRKDLEGARRFHLNQRG